MQVLSIHLSRPPARAERKEGHEVSCVFCFPNKFPSPIIMNALSEYVMVLIKGQLLVGEGITPDMRRPLPATNRVVIDIVQAPA